MTSAAPGDGRGPQVQGSGRGGSRCQQGVHLPPSAPAGLGYGRAAKIIDRMREMGFVRSADGNKPRKVLLAPQDLAEIKMNKRK